MASSMREGDGKYLKLAVLDFLDKHLSHWRNGWRQLAGEFKEYTTSDIEKFEADGKKIDQSSTKILLRDWEKRHGGCDVDYLKKCLANMGRRDILRDLEDLYKGMELVEPSSTTRSLPQYIEPFERDPDRHVPSQRNQHGQSYPQGGEDVIIVGKMYTSCDGVKLISPQQVSGLQVGLPPKGRVSANERHQDPPMDEGWNHFNDMEHRHSDSSSSKRNSDPLQRRDSHICSPSKSSGSLDDIHPGKDSPKNLKKTQSDLLPDNSSAVPSTCTCSHKSASQDRVVRRKEEDSYQGHGNYTSLHSMDNGHASPVTGNQYLLLSSEIQQDRQWCKKLCKILKRNGHRVHMLHEVHPNYLLQVFQKVDYVVVIYTENYKNEFQTQGTRNNELFQHIQSEYRRNNGTNHRFIPVYDPAVIQALPDALLRSNSCERDYILSLLRTRCPDYEGHSSAPSRNGGGGAGRDNATPTGRNNHARSQSEPHIVREFHTPPNQFKQNSTGKKESKPKFPWNKKNKKDK